VHKGGCACGKVRFEARGEPYRVGVCHCFPTEAVTVSGDVIEFASSVNAQRYSCRSCGAPVYSTYGRDDEFYLYPGSFDENGLFAPTYELWTIRREPWLPEFPSVVSRYERDRPKWKRTEP